jgi:hypothetical protein
MFASDLFLTSMVPYNNKCAVNELNTIPFNLIKQSLKTEVSRNDCIAGNLINSVQLISFVYDLPCLQSSWKGHAVV